MRALFFLLVLCLMACQSDVENQSAASYSKKSNPVNQPVSDSLSKVTIENEKDYSDDFIKELKQQEQFNTVHLSGNQMILNDSDTITFPDYPPMNKALVFTAKTNTRTINLQVKRINQSTISYKNEVVESGKLNCSVKGTADLGIFFFLGSESDTNNETGEEYFSTEYASQVEECFSSIRIGKMDYQEDGPFLAKVILDCIGECKPINLDNCPILIEK